MKTRLSKQSPISRLSENADHILKIYLRRLNNLGGNNRSVLLLRLGGDQLVDLYQLGYLNGEKAFGIIASLIAGRKKKICPVLDSRMEAANEVSKKLKQLQRVDKFIFEERGSNDLHVGWPFVRGKFSDGTLIRAPLLFSPVEIIHDNSDWLLHLRKDAGLTLNKSFLLSYAHFNKVQLNEGLMDASFEDFDTDSTVFRTQLYQLLKERIEINFNSETFTDSLHKFQEFRKEEFEQSHHNGEIKLYPEAVLGIFPQSGSQLVPDYLHMMDEKPIENLEQFFLTKNAAAPQSDIRNSVAVNLAVKEEKIYSSFPLDEWQEHALKSTKLGHSIVVQGPPGTGKSQLIANLICDSIASGKRILLVCQKRVALDVVYERLKSISLSDFVGLVHDFRGDRKEIFRKIASQIDRLDEYKARNRGIDVIQTERRFFQICRAIDRITEELEEFRKSLFDDSECGLSVKELYLSSDIQAPRINMRQEYQYFHFQTLREFLLKLKSYAGYARNFEKENYPWRNRKSFAGYQFPERIEIEKTVLDISEFQRQLGADLTNLIGAGLNLEEAESLLNRKEQADEMVKLLTDESVYSFFKSMVKEKDDETSLLWLQNMERVCMNCFDGPGVESSLREDQVGKCQVALHQRMEARRKPFRLIRWELFSDHKFFLKRVLIANGLKYNKQGLRTLEQRLDNRLNLEHHRTALKAKKWLIELPPLFDGRQFRKWFEKQQLAVRAKLILSSLREVGNWIYPDPLSREQFIRLIWDVFDVLQRLPEHKAQWLQYLTTYQVTQLAFSPDLTDTFIKSLQQDFDSLCESDKIKDSFQPYETEIINRIFDELLEWDADKFEAAFQNSLRQAWIEHMETKYPVLRAVSTLRIDQLEEEIFQSIAEKQKTGTEIVLLRARERIYERVEYNRLNNRITYRDLHHQVNKRKKIWPIRKVITEFQDELFNLLPCWMASPESVSAIFPMKEMFDMVIFDEASQCFAERGLPAMFRGKQIVIAGDGNQLKPFDLYQVRWEEENENPETELDSLLDLSSRYLPTVSLHGHYRSRYAELIDFSNHHFYKGTLNLLPDKIDFNQGEVPISFIRIEGEWKDQSNLPEAIEVVNRIVDIIRQHPEKEIGVITFNAPQQALIADRLEEQVTALNMKTPPSLFVKNIENVQGDEKDIIFFSIGYAPDKSRKLAMQFGSLNIQGGENRLNVAITRAREKVIIISSIGPEDLKLQGIKNDGPKLLRAYLEYAMEVSSGRRITLRSLNGGHNKKNGLSSQLHEWAASQIKNAAFETNTMLPVCDLMVIHDQQAEGVIQTDDQAFKSALNAKGPYAYTPALLASKGWNFRRVYSREWWINRQKVETEMKKFAHTITPQ